MVSLINTNNSLNLPNNDVLFQDKSQKISTITSVKKIVNELSQILFQNKNSSVTTSDASQPRFDLQYLENKLAEEMFSYREENPDNPSLEESGNKHKNNIKQYKLRKALDLQGVSIPKP